MKAEKTPKKTHRTLTSTTLESIQALLDEHGLTPPAELGPTCRRYLDLLQHHGKLTNLVGNLEDEFLENDLVLGSLQLLRVGMPVGHLLDVGSGAGIPGIPLAICLPGLNVTLMEIRKKRVAFLRLAVMELKLRNVQVACKRVESWPSASTDWVVARAFLPPTRWLEVASRIVRPKGSVVVFSSKSRWAEAEVPPSLETVRVEEDRTGSDRIVARLTPLSMG